MTAHTQALIFDMDGVLIDSEPLWRRAEIEVFAEVGLELVEQDCLETTGLRIDEAVAYWFERAPWEGPTVSEVAQRIVVRVAALVRRDGELMAGAETALAWATAAGFRVALASSSPMTLIETVLDRFEIGKAFEVARSAEDEAYGKPHPAVYLRTARELGLDPRVCVAIEDSANGVASALAAGMRCIAIPPPEALADPRFASAGARIDSLRELEAALLRV